jgi:pyrimidine operon attenuation protein/uracil phosphoribosyltransferase
MGSVVLDSAGIRRTLSRMAHEVLESTGGVDDLVVLGILRRGWPAARRLAFLMSEIDGSTVPCGKLDVRSQRDDKLAPHDDLSEINSQVAGKRVLLVDEVVFTGRTVRAAMNKVLEFGRPKSIQLAAVIDRGHRELPIQPNYVGRTLESAPEDYVIVTIDEPGREDRVELIPARERQEVRA